MLKLAFVSLGRGGCAVGHVCGAGCGPESLPFCLEGKINIVNVYETMFSGMFIKYEDSEPQLII